MVRGCWAAIMLLAFLGAGFAWARQAGGGIEICHIANAGFALRGAEGAVIIDGLFRRGLPDYQHASKALNEKLETAAPPFDQVRVVVASHDHADHFSARALVRHAAHSPHTQYVVTPQARARLIAAGLPPRTNKRVHGVYPANDGQVRIADAGITVTVYRISHGKGHSTQNIGTLVEIGGLMVFHTGDMELYPEELAEAGITGLEVDVLLVPFWLLLEEKNGRQVAAAFAAKHVIPMHAPDKEQSWMEQYGGLQGIQTQIESNVPNSRWMTGQMACGHFGRAESGGR